MIFRLACELRARRYEVHFVGPSNGCGWLGNQFRDHGFPTHTFVLRRALDARCLRDLIATMRGKRFDLVHSHLFAMAVYGTAASAFVGVPHVITMHGVVDETRFLRRRMALRWAFRCSQALIAVSAETKRTLRAALGTACDRMRVIINGVPDEQGAPGPLRRELGIGDHELLVVAVGRGDHGKAHIVLLQALQRLPVRVPWRVAIAGPYDDATPALREFITRHGWERRAHLLGPRHDVPDLLAAADVFAMPSLREGLPLALLEAMAGARAIVASDVGGIPEAVVHGEEALLTPPGDVDGLASTLRTVLEDATLRERLGRRARRRAISEFSVAAMADAYERLYVGVRAGC